MRIALLAAAALTIAGCAQTAREPRTAATPPPAAMTASAPPAAGPSCVELSRIREAVVVDDRTIDFRLRGGETLRNTLPFRCSQLGFEKAFSYSTSISRLCSTDIITVIVQGGGPRTGASCGLGKFAPYTPVATR